MCLAGVKTFQGTLPTRTVVATCSRVSISSSLLPELAHFPACSRDAPDNSLSSRVHLASRFQRASLHRRRNPSCSEPGVLPLLIPFSNLRLYTTLRPQTLFVRARSSIFLRHFPSLSARLPASSRDPGTLKTTPQQLVTRLRFLNCTAIICLFFFFRDSTIPLLPVAITALTCCDFFTCRLMLRAVTMNFTR